VPDCDGLVQLNIGSLGSIQFVQKLALAESFCFSRV
jgi:hypothetical protein